MADSQSKIDAEAEKAFAAAAEKKAAGSISAQKVEKAVAAEPAAPVETAAIAKAVKRKPAKTKPAAGKARKKPAAKQAVAKKAASASKPLPAKKAKKPAAKPATQTPPISQLKETIMATAETATTIDYTTKAKEMAADMQTRAKAAYDKGTEMTKEAVEFQKGNLEALVESGKILVSGMQDLGRTYADEAKSAAETVQGDVKKVAEIKSPTELFQLQGDIARRNFDAMVSATSKNTEAMLKLVNDAFAPVSNRMSLAAEKVGKAA
ncbi:phasin family protein [Qipengyuania flava]|uniref:phasin family protein n=1 Tax=Qipengyuania flava TaxID=192812 RepID=UPI001C567AC8|nr:phasin family protein [Qipengyuania flava]MBW3169327.1 phasin family protein [Qipengyuania flava]MBY5966565.1 phasin family protein [Qipengyuania flava]MBY6012889.1 phasin family protein [Qipengyuania flava]MBY6027331.1 phasin family protein [Qipengyuania flava]